MADFIPDCVKNSIQVYYTGSTLALQRGTSEPAKEWEALKELQTFIKKYLGYYAQKNFNLSDTERDFILDADHNMKLLDAMYAPRDVVAPMVAQG